MSDLAATGCGCGCGGGISDSGNNGCNIILWILILSCLCGGDNNMFCGGSFLGNGGCGCGCGEGRSNNWLWIILLIAFIR